ncbi:HDIG domain-containing protein [Anaerovirgula multivorans]|uniref:HDIG domain-containing protein n=1 Tax=Anaerovirgula multivorans TaxID=312168 RepID=A0A239C0U7_9FIRM|nr:HD-GYP domain-containing protein [Anaerovirgula multivorans]SNS13750.1 HDIG domain-containing protein [Anaerovirgula multivorans]
MRKVEVPLSQCTEEDILADDIYNDKGVILVVKDTVINNFIKGRLLEMRINTVQVYSPLNRTNCLEDTAYGRFRKNYKDTVLSLKQIIHDISAGKKLDYRQLINVTDLIYKTVKENNHIISCLREIRDSDQYTYTHCVNVALYSMLIANWMKLPEEKIKKAIQAGLLHDIGKTKIPNEILNKKGRLTSGEFELMKKHTLYGYDIVNEIEGISIGVKRAVLLHHERIDCSGYPLSASAECIGIYARIVAVADVYDAMTSERVYKKKASPFDAFEMFKTIGVGMFDPKILNVFLKNLATYYIGTDVVLSNGDLGRIVYIPPQNIISPVVDIYSKYIDLSREKELKVAMIV